MTAVAFQPGVFRTQFPQYADDSVYSDTLLTAYFDAAVAVLGNEDSPVPYDPPTVYTRQTLLYRATCHLLTLADSDGAPGRLSSASQGSVSTSFDLLKANSYSGDWWAQTPCGQLVWLLLLPYTRGGRLYTAGNWHPWG